MPRRMGRPGLIGTVARTAVIAGTATAVSGSMRNRQQASAQQAQDAAAYNQQQMQAPAPAPAPVAPAPEDDMASKIADIKQLAELHDQGILTDAEFEAQKAKILG